MFTYMGVAHYMPIFLRSGWADCLLKSSETHAHKLGFWGCWPIRTCNYANLGKSEYISILVISGVWHARLHIAARGAGL